MSPLLAVLPELEKVAECVVIGRKYTFEHDLAESLEYKTLLSQGTPFFDLKAARLQRKLTRHTLPSFIKFPKSFLSAKRILKKEKPDVVLTFGGYIALPVCIAARALHIPIVLHEQTQRAGLTNKLIGIIANKVCISYSTSKIYFPKNKTVLTGNPLRLEVLKVQDKIEISTNKPILTIMGGSSGSHRINLYVKEILEKLLTTYNVIHQTGDAQEFKDYDMLSGFKEGLSPELQKGYVIRKFILPNEIGWVYKHTDVFVCRAGANTVSELLALSKKALLIPLPFSQMDEQLENAKYYKSSGLGDYVLEKDIDSEKLYTVIHEVFSKKTQAQDKAQDTHSSAEQIVQVVKDAVSYEKTKDSIKLPQES